MGLGKQFFPGGGEGAQTPSSPWISENQTFCAKHSLLHCVFMGRLPPSTFNSRVEPLGATSGPVSVIPTRDQAPRGDATSHQFVSMSLFSTRVSALLAAIEFRTEEFFPGWCVVSPSSALALDCSEELCSCSQSCPPKPAMIPKTVCQPLSQSHPKPNSNTLSLTRGSSVNIMHKQMSTRQGCIAF